jgi:hypothetical protein
MRSKAIGAKNNDPKLPMRIKEQSAMTTRTISQMSPASQDPETKLQTAQNSAKLITSPISAHQEKDVRVHHVSTEQSAKSDNRTHALLAYISPGLTAPTIIPYLDEERLRALTAKLDLPSYLENREWKVTNGILYFRDRVYIPEQLRFDLLRAAHEPPIHGHGGAHKMYNMLKNYFIWENMYKSISSFVSTCTLCQQYKVSKTRRPLRATPIPIEVFEEISLDIVGPLPNSSSGNRYILCVQDRLSRFLQFIPMSSTDAETTARKLLMEWFCVFGLPRRIISDRGTNFMSTVFRMMLEVFGVKARSTTAYRPCANGGNERTHLELHKYLGLYLQPDKKYHWDSLLKLAAWHHNVSYHESLGTSPFTVVTGLQPNLAKLWLQTDDRFPQAVEQYRKYYGVTQQELECIREKARKHIQRAQATYLANRLGGRPITLVKGDKVLRKDHRATKWSPRYVGPYIVEEVISDSVVKIKDPNSDWSDIVHADYVKKYLERDSSILPPRHDRADELKPREFMVIEDEDEDEENNSSEEEKEKINEAPAGDSKPNRAVENKQPSPKKVRFKNLLHSARRQLSRIFEPVPPREKGIDRRSILTRSKSEARGIELPKLFDVPDPPDVRRKKTV